MCDAVGMYTLVNHSPKTVYKGINLSVSSNGVGSAINTMFVATFSFHLRNQIDWMALERKSNVLAESSNIKYNVHRDYQKSDIRS